jgi:hypothetical protein
MAVSMSDSILCVLSIRTRLSMFIGSGLFGITLHIAEGLAVFGYPDITVLGIPVYLPIGLLELVYAVWLIVTGFNSQSAKINKIMFKNYSF